MLCLAAVIVTLGGCRLEGHPVWLAMTVDKTIVAMDDSVRVTLIVSNTSERTVMTHPASAYGPCLPGFQVTDGNGRAAGMYAVCIAMAPPMVPLAPGEAIDITSWWHPAITSIGGNPIGPGVYTVRAAVVADERVVRSGGFEIQVIE